MRERVRKRNDNMNKILLLITARQLNLKCLQKRVVKKGTQPAAGRFQINPVH